MTGEVDESAVGNGYSDAEAFVEDRPTHERKRVSGRQRCVEVAEDSRVRHNVRN